MIPDKPNILPLRKHNIPVMSASTSIFSNLDLLEINAYQLFFQVISLAKIVIKQATLFYSTQSKKLMIHKAFPMKENFEEYSQMAAPTVPLYV
jgi:hypothetical protein